MFSNVFVVCFFFLLNHHSFAIVRCYCSSGKVDSNCATSVSRCWEAGFSHVDVYMFPCYSCGDGGSQVETLYDYLVDNDVTYGEVWLGSFISGLLTK